MGWVFALVPPFQLRRTSTSMRYKYHTSAASVCLLQSSSESTRFNGVHIRRILLANVLQYMQLNNSLLKTLEHHSISRAQQKFSDALLRAFHSSLQWQMGHRNLVFSTSIVFFKVIVWCSTVPRQLLATFVIFLNKLKVLGTIHEFGILSWVWDRFGFSCIFYFPSGHLVIKWHHLV